MKHRTFLAIPLPPQYYEIISNIQLDLCKKAPFIPEKIEKMHITLSFLGRVEEEIVSSLKNRSLPRLFKETNMFPIELKFIESMYRKRESSFVYLAPSVGDKEVKEMHEKIVDILSNFNIPQPQRFMPHMVIAKTPKSDPETTKKWLDNLDNYEFEGLPSFNVEKITFYESFLSKKGSTYQRLADFSLRHESINE